MSLIKGLSQIQWLCQQYPSPSDYHASSDE